MTTTKRTLTLITSGRDWRSRAACLGTDPELFFPVAETGPLYDAQVAAAKHVCARCPVATECLAEAMARIPYGIAGGLTEDERRTVTRSRRASVVGAERADSTEAGGQAA